MHQRLSFLCLEISPFVQGAGERSGGNFTAFRGRGQTLAAASEKDRLMNLIGDAPLLYVVIGLVVYCPCILAVFIVHVPVADRALRYADCTDCSCPHVALNLSPRL